MHIYQRRSICKRTNSKHTRKYPRYTKMRQRGGLQLINKCVFSGIVVYIMFICLMMNTLVGIHYENTTLLNKSTRLSQSSISCSEEKESLVPPNGIYTDDLFEIPMNKDENTVINLPSEIIEEDESTSENNEVSTSDEEIEEVEKQEKTEEEDLGYRIYTVREGDTLYNIASRSYGNGEYCISIILENDLDPLDPSIYEGDKLIIPDDFDKDLKYTPYIQELKGIEEDKVYIGDFKITGYDIYCSHCCGGKSDGITSSGKPARVGVTIALNRSYGIPYGTTVYIEDYGYYIVEDSGLARGYVDIACGSHSECYDLTSEGTCAVYIVK